jgi:hypothetical protein
MGKSEAYHYCSYLDGLMHHVLSRGYETCMKMCYDQPDAIYATYATLLLGTEATAKLQAMQPSITKPNTTS